MSKNKRIITTSCRLCGGSSFDIRFVAIEKDVHGEPQNLMLLNCTNCGYQADWSVNDILSAMGIKKGDARLFP